MAVRVVTPKPASSYARTRAEFQSHLGHHEREAMVLSPPPADIFQGDTGAAGLEDILPQVAATLDMELVLVGHVDGSTYTTLAYHAHGGKAGIQRGDTIPIGETYCREEITAEKPFVLGDAELEPRFQQHPGYVKYGLRAYVGAPLVLSDGTLFGTLCGVDSAPKRIGLTAVEHLVEAARQLSARLSERLGLPPAPTPPRPHWGRSPRPLAED